MIAGGRRAECRRVRAQTAFCRREKRVVSSREDADELRDSHPQPRRFGDRETNPARPLPWFRILLFLPSLLPDLQIVTHLPVAPPP